MDAPARASSPRVCALNRIKGSRMAEDAQLPDHLLALLSERAAALAPFASQTLRLAPRSSSHA